MEIEKIKSGEVWFVIQRWPRIFQKIESEFKTEREADVYIAQVKEIVAAI